MYRPPSGPGLHEILEQSQQQRFIFFGGKGGVGKTSVSTAVAVKCADQVILQSSHRVNLFLFNSNPEYNGWLELEYIFHCFV